MTFAEAAAIHLRNLDDNPRIKPRTRHYWRQRLAALIKSWPGNEQNGSPQDHAGRVQKVGKRVYKDRFTDKLQQHRRAPSTRSERRN